MVHDLGGVWLVVACCEVGLCACQADGIAEALTQGACTTRGIELAACRDSWLDTAGLQRTGGDLNALCDEILWVARRLAVQLPEVLAVLQLQQRACQPGLASSALVQVQQTVQGRTLTLA